MKASPNAAGASNATARSTVPVRQDYLVFRLADREYGIVLGKVQELCNYDIVKPLTDAPRTIAGVITLRSRKIAVVNLHEILAPGNLENGWLADVVILELGGHVTGIAVDCVIDVVAVLPDQIRNAKATGVLGIAEVGQRTITLLDADKLATYFHPSPLHQLAA